MPIQMQYDESEHVFHYIAIDPITVEEMTKYAKQNKVHLDTSSMPIFTLVDARRVKKVPQGALRGRNNPEFTHPNSAGIVIVGASLLVRTVSSIVAKLTNMENLVFLESMDDAWSYIRNKTTQPTA